MTSSNFAVFLDAETTGLDIRHDHLLQVGIIIVNRGFEIIDEHDWIVASDELVADINNDRINDFIKKMHGPEGTDLLRVAKLAHGMRWATVQPESVEKRMHDFVKPYIKDSKPPLWGSSVHFDKYFLQDKMPIFLDLFNHRLVDSSSDLSALEFTHPEVKKMLDVRMNAMKVGDHTVLNDLRDSIAIRRILTKLCAPHPVMSL